MHKSLWLLLVAALGCSGLARHTSSGAEREDDDAWTSDFGVLPGELTSTGSNPWFVLEPGYQSVLQGGKEDAERVVITVLDETKLVAGVETRVVEERETKDDVLVEVSRNYYAISKRTNSVFYFGEDVDIYEAGKVVSHEGAWLAGVDGAKFGLMMPGQPLIGARYCQEVAPKRAMDRAEIVSVGEAVKTAPDFAYTGCVRIEETTPLEPGDKSYKLYAPGPGLLQDDELKLVESGMTKTYVK